MCLYLVPLFNCTRRRIDGPTFLKPAPQQAWAWRQRRPGSYSSQHRRHSHGGAARRSRALTKVGALQTKLSVLTVRFPTSRATHSSHDLCACIVWRFALTYVAVCVVAGDGEDAAAAAMEARTERLAAMGQAEAAGAPTAELDAPPEPEPAREPARE